VITDAILAIVLAPIRAVVGMLPTWTLPGWLSSTGSGSMGDIAASIGVQAGGIDGWLPMTNAVQLLSWYFTLLGAVAVWKGAQFAISLFSGGGGST
jgi:hypothetical protein